MSPELPEPKLAVDIGFESSGASLEKSQFLIELAKGIPEGEKLRTALLYGMKDFGPYMGQFLFNQAGRIESEKLPPADLVFLTFVNVCEHTFGGRFEKVAWSCAFTYKTIPFAFSLQKFGLRLYHHKDAAPSIELIDDMLGALHKAMGIISKLMEPVARAQIAAGNVTIENSFCKLDNMYGYFRKQAKDNFAKLPPPEKPEIEDLGKLLTNAFQRDAAGAYNTIAMIDAYFSRLEHLLVILLAFQRAAGSKPELLKEIAGLWSDKFKRIFPFGMPGAKALYERLVALREKQRNPIAHGNFRKDGKSLYFHFAAAGAVSCDLTSQRTKASMFLADEEDYLAACTLFDEMDKFIAESPLRFGFLYAKSGLNVAYDDETIAKYQAASSDDETFYSFLEEQSYIADMRANMDW